MMDQDLKNMVIGRLSTIPEGMEISVGSFGSFKKDDLIKNVKDETEVGKKMVDIELTYMKDLISGKLYKNLG